MTNPTSHPSIRPIALDFAPAARIGARVAYYHSPQQGRYGLDVHFADPQPEPRTIFRVLRECAAIAAAEDVNSDIIVNAFRLPHTRSDLDQREMLSPYGSDHLLCFDASLRQVGVRSRDGKEFVELVHIDESAADDEDEDEDVEGSTGDMMYAVENWIWYGFHSVGELDEQIDAEAEDDDDIDVDRVKAFAAKELKKKRIAEASWQVETDCDRLDKAFHRLKAKGICAIHFPESGYTMEDGRAAVEEAMDAAEDSQDHFVGYCFYHAQDIDGAREDEGLLLAFGSTVSEADEDDVRIGQTVCEALQQEGLQTEWDGTVKRRIHLPGMRWQRRTPA